MRPPSQWCGSANAGAGPHPARPAASKGRVWRTCLARRRRLHHGTRHAASVMPGLERPGACGHGSTTPAARGNAPTRASSTSTTIHSAHYPNTPVLLQCKIFSVSGVISLLFICAGAELRRAPTCLFEQPARSGHGAWALRSVLRRAPCGAPLNRISSDLNDRRAAHPDVMKRAPGVCSTGVSGVSVRTRVLWHPQGGGSGTVVVALFGGGSQLPSPFSN